MYEVFVNENRIVLLSHSCEQHEKTKQIGSKKALRELVNSLLVRQKKKPVYLRFSEAKDPLVLFKKPFKEVIAAGGLVRNKKHEVLFIYRNNKWDLPKGKVEKNEGLEEAAVREVCEETGLPDVILGPQRAITYHIFRRRGELRLKTTFWYEMRSDFKGKLEPQLDEGITEVVWLGDAEQHVALRHSYKNIVGLFSGQD
ncbi:MAG: NUDIX domain-containing protein [Flavobacteriaceae bacterium]